jgi:hypothetical protein
MTNHDHSEDTSEPLQRDGTNLEDGPSTANVDDEDPGWPWSFILLVVAGALYLIFRFAEVIIKLVT